MRDINESDAKEIYSYYVTTLRAEKKKSLKIETKNALDNKTRKKVLSDKEKEEVEEKAARSALQATLVKSFSNFKSDYPVDQLWSELRSDSLLRHSNMKRVASNVEKVEKVVSAHNSWASVSGHGFEHIVQGAISEALSNKGEDGGRIKVIFPNELTDLLDTKSIAAGAKTLNLLKNFSKPFDLFCIYEKDNSTFCFGLIQTKTSPRERLKKEAAPSRKMMKSGFFSAAVVLYGKDLNGKSYKELINNQFNWDRVYALSDIQTEGRLIRIDNSMEKIADDLITAQKHHSIESGAVHDSFREISRIDNSNNGLAE